MITQDEHTLHRAVERLSRPGAWLDQAGAIYRIRMGVDRRSRPLMALSEADFAALAKQPGLSPRAGGGGWRLARIPSAGSPPPPGRPGRVEGERLVVDPDGGFAARRANLGASALAWLAARKDAAGRPWLDAVDLAVAERLSIDHERVGLIGRLTMSWDCGPRGSGPHGLGMEPAEQARSAKDRLAAALDALPPRERAVVERVVLMREPLAAVERHLGLPRRTARTVLKAGLAVLARHYRVGEGGQRLGGVGV